MRAVVVLIRLMILTIILQTTLQDKNKSHNRKTPGACFCELKGEVDDCECKIESIDTLNNEKIYPRLQSLVSRDYFRYFKVNLNKVCPFWSDDSQCALKDCHVKSCPEQDVPEGIKKEKEEEKPIENKYTKEAQEEEQEPSCAEERELSALDTTISKESREAFQNWTKYDDQEDKFCELDDDNSSDCNYVDLLLNPERYTGYRGASPHRIWRSIYEENCFNSQGLGYGSQQSLTGLCLEKRTFYRLVSGLHTSINIHLCAEYLFQASGLAPPQWKPNVKEFQRRFGPDKTNGFGPQRLKNLYFTYLVELRALAKVAPYLEKESFFTGNDDEDLDVKNGITELLQIIKSFPNHFDEKKLFQGKSKDMATLKEEFRTHFLNISRIMDCVGCVKCRLWGKIQTQGMGTALKILFSGENLGSLSILDGKGRKGKFQLRRTEIVSLINAFARLSSSIHSIEMFRHLLR